MDVIKKSGGGREGERGHKHVVGEKRERDKKTEKSLQQCVHHHSFSLTLFLLPPPPPIQRKKSTLPAGQSAEQVPG